MRQAVAQGFLLISGKTAGHLQHGQLLVAEAAHSMMVKACDWPSVKQIGDLAAD